MKDSTRRLLAGVLGVLLAAVVGSAVGTTLVVGYGLPQAYGQAISMAFIAPAVMLTSLARDDFERARYYRQRGRKGIALDVLATGLLGLLGGLLGASVADSLTLSGTLLALLPFVGGMLAGAAVYIFRNREFYQQSPV